MSEHYLSADVVHREWNRGIRPVLHVTSGDTVTIETRDASDGYFSPNSLPRDAAAKPPFSGHPLTGPIYVERARPGQSLVVEVLDVEPAAWGFTALYPGMGLLSEDFPEAYVRGWDLSDGVMARGMPGVAVPISAFPGIVGVAPSAPGPQSTSPPGDHGGNMDVRQLFAGSRLRLPVLVDGGLLSIGDAHAAQGEGEVCLTAIEMRSTTRIRIHLSDVSVGHPHVTSPSFGDPSGAVHGCVANGTELLATVQTALRQLIQWICHERGLDAADAYVLCSVAAQLRLSQVVNAPRYTVTGFIPLGVFE